MKLGQFSTRRARGFWMLKFGKPNPKKAQMRRWYAPGRRQEIHQLQWCQRWNWETDRPSSWCLGLRSWDFAIDFAFFANETVVYLSRLRLVLPRWKRCGLIFGTSIGWIGCLRGSNKGIVNDPIILTIYATGAPDLTLIDLPGITRVPVKGSDQKDDVEKVTGRSYGEWDSSYFTYEPSTFCSHQPWFNDLLTWRSFFDFFMGSVDLNPKVLKVLRHCSHSHIHQWRKPFHTSGLPDYRKNSWLLKHILSWPCCWNRKKFRIISGATMTVSQVAQLIVGSTRGKLQGPRLVLDEIAYLRHVIKPF